jgi:hypothetical protein
MKRMIMAAALLVSTVSVFAADIRKGDIDIDHKIERNKEQMKGALCTVTMETSISVPGVSVKVSCSASSTSCKEAIAMANNCLDEAKKLLID